jgi:hypothetical protein
MIKRPKRNPPIWASLRGLAGIVEQSIARSGDGVKRQLKAEKKLLTTPKDLYSFTA